jgi:hypothetical protein
MGVDINATPRPPYLLGRDLIPIVEKAGWDPGLVWTGAKSLALTGIRSPDRPAYNNFLDCLKVKVQIKGALFICLLIYVKDSVLLSEEDGCKLSLGPSVI